MASENTNYNNFGEIVNSDKLLEKVKSNIQSLSGWSSTLTNEEKRTTDSINVKYLSLITNLSERRDLILSNVANKYSSAQEKAARQISQLESFQDELIKLENEQSMKNESLSLKDLESKLIHWKAKQHAINNSIDNFLNSINLEYNICRCLTDHKELGLFLSNYGTSNEDLALPFDTEKKVILNNEELIKSILDIAYDSKNAFLYVLAQEQNKSSEIIIRSLKSQQWDENIDNISLEKFSSTKFLFKRNLVGRNIAVNIFYIFITIPETNSLLILTKAGEFIENMSVDKCRQPQPFASINGISVDDKEYLLICDGGNNRVLILRPDLQLTFSIWYSDFTLTSLNQPFKAEGIGDQKMIVLHKGYPPLHMYNYQGEAIAFFGALGFGMDRFVPRNLCVHIPLDKMVYVISIGDYGPLPDYVIIYQIKDAKVYHAGSIDNTIIDGMNLTPGLCMGPNGKILVSLLNKPVIYVIPLIQGLDNIRIPSVEKVNN